MQPSSDTAPAARLGRDAGLKLPLAEATRAQFDRMVDLGLGGLDKSGVAELTFKDRHG
jgi:3-hydroxyisobutyrate dehydrogenase